MADRILYIWGVWRTACYKAEENGGPHVAKQRSTEDRMLQSRGVWMTAYFIDEKYGGPQIILSQALLGPGDIHK